MIRNIGRVLARDRAIPVKWAYTFEQAWWHWTRKDGLGKRHFFKGSIRAIFYIWYWQIRRYCR